MTALPQKHKSRCVVYKQKVLDCAYENKKCSKLGLNLRKMISSTSDLAVRLEDIGLRSNVQTNPSSISNNMRVTVSNNALKKKRSVWTKDKQQALKSLGKEYIGSSKSENRRVSVIKKAKTITVCCCESNRCRKNPDKYKCHLFEDKIRSKICQNFWQGGEQKRIEFILHHVVNDPKSNSIVGCRPDHRTYSLPFIDEKLTVCSKMFTSTLSVEKTFIFRVFKQKNSVPLMKKVTTRPETQQHQELKQFLALLPTLPSHYNRANSSKKYLARDVESVAELFQIYKKTEEEAGRKPFQRSKFFEEFSNSNYRIYVPLRDRCETCQALEKNVEENGSGTEELSEHREEVNHNKVLIDLIFFVCVHPKDKKAQF